MSEWASQVDRLRSQAASLAGALAATARTRTTLGQERALLRLLGVDGLDRAGRPLAASVVEKSCSLPGALASGVVLPFGAALAEYAVPARDLALDVASGDVDLALEGSDLEDPEAAARARAALTDLAAAAIARIDANRTARRELRDVLGDAAAPWIGLSVAADESESAATEVRKAIRGGAAIVRIRVPANWEFRRATERVLPQARTRRSLVGRRRGRGAEVPDRHDVQETPAGSQRGLSMLREAADEAAAARGCYASLMTATSALAAPEQAVVAAFERIDFMEADSVREIVEGNVDPDRALADHAFAHKLHRRAGAQLVIGPGPLAIGPELEAGVPASLATRAGRALALQAVEVELALADGLGTDSVVVGAVPLWVPEERGVRSVVAQAWLRAVAFSDHPLALEVTSRLGHLELVGALAGIHASGRLRLSGAPLVVLLDGDKSSTPDAVAAARAVAEVAGDVADSIAGSGLRSSADALAIETLHTANAVLAQFADEGWAAVLGRSAAHSEASVGASGVVDRGYEYDPLGT